MLIHAFITSMLTLNCATFTKVFPLLCTEREQINLKVVQTLGNDKVQVGFTGFFLYDDNTSAR